jgi:hypothetical protein
MQASYEKDITRRWDIAVLWIALGSVPLAKIMMMYGEYRLHWQLHHIAEPLVLVLALGLAVIATLYTRRPWSGQLLRIAAIAAWSFLAYVLVSFVPGCMWAPACV